MVELISRLAEHHSDQQIASILCRHGHRTGMGLVFTESRIRAARQRAGIPPAPPPDPTSRHTVTRWLKDGLLPDQQGAAWRIRLTDEVKARFVPEVPDGRIDSLYVVS